MRLRDTRTRIGTGLLRGGGQVAMSVAATLIATGLFALWRPAEPPARPAPEVTAGGKFGARIAGAALPATEPDRPRLSIVDWAITPANPTRLVSDVAWQVPTAGWEAGAKPAAAESRPAPRPHRRPAAAAPASPAPAAAVASFPAIVAPADPPRGLLAGVTDAAVSVASGTRRAAEAAGSGALKLGSGAMGRLAALLP